LNPAIRYKPVKVMKIILESGAVFRSNEKNNWAVEKDFYFRSPTRKHPRQNFP